MVPKSAMEFGKAVRELGVREGRPVVVYARENFIASARAWWMLRLFGKHDVGVLNCNWVQWQGPTETGAVAPFVDDGVDIFEAKMNKEMIRDMDEMVAHSQMGDAMIIDARSHSRFLGGAREPLAGLREGHIPGSLSTPYSDLVNDGRLVGLDKLREYFAIKSVSADKRPVVATCGSGVTACILALALHVAENRDVAVYDGSWSEYRKCADNPVETGNGAKM